MPKTIIWLSGMPRSGTNWASQIFASSPQIRAKFCPLYSYEFKNELDENSTPEDWEAFFPRVYDTQSDYMDQEYLRRDGHVPDFKEKEDQPPILFIKSIRFHNLIEGILRKHSGIRFVGMVRDPRAAIHSWLSNPLEFPKDADPVKEWRTGACRKTGAGEFWGFDDWKFVAGLYLKLQKEWPERFFLIRYENLVANPVDRTRELFQHLDIPFHDQTQSFLTECHQHHSDHKRSVFKKPDAINTWKNCLAPDIIKTIEGEINGTPLAQFFEDSQ